jgi:hypothetical protein
MKYLTLLLLALSFNALSVDCYRELTKNFTGDSQHFTQFSSDEEIFSNPNEYLDAQMAVNAINKTLKDLGCADRVELEYMQCEKVLNTKLCRLNHKYGYFIVLKDYVDTVNIIFNRWD